MTLDEVLAGITRRSAQECSEAFAVLEEEHSPELILAIERQAEKGLGTRQIFEARIQGAVGIERSALELTALAVEHVVRRTKNRTNTKAANRK